MATVYSYSPLIRLADLAYPKYFADLKAEYPNILFGATPPEETVLDFGYALVHDVEIPTGDVVTEGSPQPAEDGLWYKTWVVRSFNEEELAANLATAKEVLQSQAAAVYTSDISTGVEVTLGGSQHYISISPESISNLLMIKDLTSSASDTDAFSIKTSDNGVVSLLKQDFLTMTSEVFSSSYAISKEYWAYLVQIADTTLIDNLPALPTTFKS